MPKRTVAPREQSKRFIAAAKAAEADQSESAFEERLKAVAKHQPPLATIKAPKKPTKK